MAGRVQTKAKKKPKSGAESTPTPPPDSTEIAPLVGANLRRLRQQNGLSLEKLAAKSGVSRAMLGQVELGQSAPTINVLWKIARALDVPFSRLLEASDASKTIVLRRRDGRLLTNQTSTFSTRALFPNDSQLRAEFYELTIKPGATENAEPHAPGTIENLVLTKGVAEIEVAGERHLLAPGDSILFAADTPHAYSNPAETDAVLYLVMTYASPGG